MFIKNIGIYYNAGFIIKICYDAYEEYLRTWRSI